jgi:hypothetical protein
LCEAALAAAAWRRCNYASWQCTFGWQAYILAGSCLNILSHVQAEAKRQYPSREQVDLVGCKSEEQRRTLVARCRAASEKLARQAKEPFTFHPPAAAHFWGFWADEESDGAGDHQHVSDAA